MGKFEPIIIDEGPHKLLSAVNVPELPFGSLSQVPVAKEIWDGVSYPRDMAGPDFHIMQS